MVYHLYVGEADKLGNVPNVVDAQPVSLPPMGTASPAPGASPAAGTKPGPKPGPTASPAAKTASPAPKASASPKK